MRTLSICFLPDNLCQAEWVKHPLIYYRAKCRRKKRAAATAGKPEEKAQVSPEKAA
jgi:DNA primase large subunit